MINLESHGKEIKRLHHMAHQMASDAIENARTAGMLLLEVKQAMKHGKFQQWIRENIQVSLRQAQRYMAVAEGKTIPLRRLIEKNDTVSHLDSQMDQGVVVDGKWMPKIGYYYVFIKEKAVFWIFPNLQLNGFHISKHYQIERDPNIPIEQFADPDDPYDQREWDGMSMYDGTKLAVRQNIVDESLRYFGIEDPTSVIWNLSGACKGSARPFGEPLNGRITIKQLSKVEQNRVAIN